MLQKYLPHLVDIKKHSEKLLSKNKNRMQHALRYFGKGRCAPEHIEKIVKYFYLFEKDIQLNNIYNIENIEIIYKKIEKTEQNKTSFQVQIDNNLEDITIYKDKKELLTIDYQGRTYKELPKSWNAYSHTLSQWEMMKNWMKIDNAWGLINEDEKQILSILNDFHDIPEWYIGDMITLQKTQNHKDKEYTIFIEKVVKQFPKEYQDFIKKIEKEQDTQYSLFKFYERLIYVTHDVFIFKEMEKYLPKEKYKTQLFYMLWWIFILEKEWILPNGKKIIWKDIPSAKESIKEDKEKFINLIEEIEIAIKNKEIKKAEYTYPKYGCKKTFYEMKKNREDILTE